MPVKHVLKVNGYGGRQAKGNEKRQCFKGWETLEGNLYQWLSKNLRYPKDAVSRKEQGRVMVQFIITAKGEVIQPEIVRSVSPSLDKEALRVVSKMPAWNPGRNGNKKVATKYTLPVKFSLGSK